MPCCSPLAGVNVPILKDMLRLRYSDAEVFGGDEAPARAASNERVPRSCESPKVEPVGGNFGFISVAVWTIAAMGFARSKVEGLNGPTV